MLNLVPHFNTLLTVGSGFWRFVMARLARAEVFASGDCACDESRRAAVLFAG